MLSAQPLGVVARPGVGARRGQRSEESRIESLWSSPYKSCGGPENAVVAELDRKRVHAVAGTPLMKVEILFVSQLHAEVLSELEIEARRGEDPSQGRRGCAPEKSSLSPCSTQAKAQEPIALADGGRAEGEHTGKRVVVPDDEFKVRSELSPNICAAQDRPAPFFHASFRVVAVRV